MNKVVLMTAALLVLSGCQGLSPGAPGAGTTTQEAARNEGTFELQATASLATTARRAVLATTFGEADVQQVNLVLYKRVGVVDTQVAQASVVRTPLGLPLLTPVTFKNLQAGDYVIVARALNTNGLAISDDSRSTSALLTIAASSKLQVTVPCRLSDTPFAAGGPSGVALTDGALLLHGYAERVAGLSAEGTELDFDDAGDMWLVVDRGLQKLTRSGEGFAAPTVIWPDFGDFDTPNAIAFDPVGNVYVSSPYKVFKLIRNVDGSYADPVIIAEGNTFGVAIGPDGDLYMANAFAVSRYAWNAQTATHDMAQATHTFYGFGYPKDLFVDAAGAVYVGSSQPVSFQKAVLQNGNYTVSTIASVPNAAGARMTVDGAGNVYASYLDYGPPVKFKTVRYQPSGTGYGAEEVLNLGDGFHGLAFDGDGRLFGTHQPISGSSSYPVVRVH